MRAWRAPARVFTHADIDCCLNHPAAVRGARAVSGTPHGLKAFTTSRMASRSPGRICVPDTHYGRVVVDSPFTEFARTTLGSGLVIGASVVVFAGTLFWAGQRGRADRWRLVVAGGIGTTFIALLNVVLGSAGMWRSTDYTLSVAVLGSFLLFTTAMLTWTVVFYLWLWRRRRGRIVSAVLLGLVAVLTAVGDESALARGYIAFGGGYAVWMDAVVAVAIFIVSVLAYELPRRRRA